MHVTHYWPCIGGCGKKMDSDIFDRFWGKGHLKCPDSDKWRRVIESNLPHCKTTEEADVMRSKLLEMGFSSSGYHYVSGDQYVVSVRIIEDTLEALMKHEAIDGAKFHGYNEEVMCPDCIARIRKEAYDGTEKVPEIKCPVCDAVLLPIHKDE